MLMSRMLGDGYLVRMVDTRSVRLIKPKVLWKCSLVLRFSPKFGMFGYRLKLKLSDGDLPMDDLLLWITSLIGELCSLGEVIAAFFAIAKENRLITFSLSVRFLPMCGVCV